MSDNKKPRVYAKGVFLKEVDLGSWKKISMSGKADEFCEFIQSIKNAKGYYNLDLVEKKEEYKKEFSTHDLFVNDYTPKEKANHPTDATNPSDDLPF